VWATETDFVKTVEKFQRLLTPNHAHKPKHCDLIL